MAETGTNNAAANGNKAADANQSAVDGALDTAKTLVASAQETVTGAAGSVVDKVKENPKAAAAIAAGAVAAVAGAVYGVTKLREGETVARKTPADTKK